MTGRDAIADVDQPARHLGLVDAFTEFGEPKIHCTPLQLWPGHNGLPSSLSIILPRNSHVKCGKAGPGDVSGAFSIMLRTDSPRRVRGRSDSWLMDIWVLVPQRHGRSRDSSRLSASLSILRNSRLPAPASSSHGSVGGFSAYSSTDPTFRNGRSTPAKTIPKPHRGNASNSNGNAGTCCTAWR